MVQQVVEREPKEELQAPRDEARLRERALRGVVAVCMKTAVQ